MSDENSLIPYRKQISMGLGIEASPSIESPFKNGPDHGVPGRGEMKDSQRRAGKTENGYDK